MSISPELISNFLSGHYDSCFEQFPPYPDVNRALRFIIPDLLKRGHPISPKIRDMATEMWELQRKASNPRISNTKLTELEKQIFDLETRMFAVLSPEELRVYC